MQIVQSSLLFIVAGLFEIGGGYLMWQWIKKGQPFVVGLAGAILLVLYGVLPNFQPSIMFGRIYAAYGGVFIIMSLLWDWKFDKRVPDKADCWGAVICLIGVAVIMYWPRKVVGSVVG
jgi:small multidrug resistance family-3 protein